MRQTKKTKPAQKATPKQETLKERVHRHLQDINSEITDDDIRSVKTELEIRTNNSDESLADKSEEKNVNKNSQAITPWNELSEDYD